MTLKADMPLTGRAAVIDGKVILLPKASILFDTIVILVDQDNNKHPLDCAKSLAQSGGDVMVWWPVDSA